MRPIRTCGLAALALAATAAPAAAHVPAGLGGGLGAGLLHPLSGLDHLLAMLAVGLWAAQLGGRALYGLPAAFLTAMALGGLAGLTFVGAAPVELAVVGSVAVLGAAVAFGAGVPAVLAGSVVALFGLIHGHAHGAELVAGGDAVSYALGFLLSTAALHAVGLLGALALQRVNLAPVVRLSGGVIAATGMVLLVAG